MFLCLHMYTRPELLWTPGSSQTRLRSLRWIFILFLFLEVRLLYTMQGDPVPVVLISQLSTPLGDKWSETVVHIWKSPKPVSPQCYQRASTGASSSLNICVHACAVYGQICFSDALETALLLRWWSGDAHLSWWISCSCPLPFLQVHFIFISSKLERVNSIPSRLWLGTFTISRFRSLSSLSLCF